VFAVDFDGKEGFVFSPEEAFARGILFDLNGRRNFTPAPGRSPRRFELRPVTFEHYSMAFGKVMYHLQRGDTYLLNLTFPTALLTDLTPEEIFHSASAPYRLLVPGRFVVFSPEIFVRTGEGMIHSYPMKGTIGAEITDAGRVILEDRKEFYEHNTIVDLIRNDLSMVSTGVEVTRFRYIDRIHTNRGDLLQVSSEIRGRLPSNWQRQAGEILFRLLPAGSVTGAPKRRTMEIIREAEGYDRAFYTGVFGYFNGEELDSAVAIRFIEVQHDRLVFKSGGGITTLSEARAEYNEMIQKVYVPVI
jgi:para-aminobenzoate synthetase component 1